MADLPFDLDEFLSVDENLDASILDKLPPAADESLYPPMSSEWLDAREFNRNRERAIPLIAAGKPYEHLLDRHPISNRAQTAPSQLVTDEQKARSPQLRSQSDLVRQHLRQQLHAARRRALKAGNPDLVHQRWLDNIDELYEFAGSPPEPIESMKNLVYKFVCVDTSGPFDPDNTQWMSKDAIQMRLSTRRVVFEGEDIPLTELAKRCGLSVATVRARYDAGIRGERLWSGRRLNAKYDIDVNGETVSLEQMAKMAGISPVTLRARIKRGIKGEALWSKDDLRTPKRRLKYNADTPEHLIRAELKELTRQYERAQKADPVNPREVAAIFDRILQAKRKLESLEARLSQVVTATKNGRK